jgi:hypothetical protein
MEGYVGKTGMVTMSNIIGLVVSGQGRERERERRERHVLSGPFLESIVTAGYLCSTVSLRRLSMGRFYHNGPCRMVFVTSSILRSHAFLSVTNKKGLW